MEQNLTKYFEYYIHPCRLALLIWPWTWDLDLEPRAWRCRTERHTLNGCSRPEISSGWMILMTFEDRVPFRPREFVHQTSCSLNCTPGWALGFVPLPLLFLLSTNPVLTSTRITPVLQGFHQPIDDTMVGEQCENHKIQSERIWSYFSHFKA